MTFQPEGQAALELTTPSSREAQEAELPPGITAGPAAKALTCVPSSQEQLDGEAMGEPFQAIEG